MDFDNFDITKDFFIEKRVVKVSSKRQFTIPKVYMDVLNNPHELTAYLLKDGTVLLEPKKD